MSISNTEIENRILKEFKDNEWKSYRSFIRTVEDRNPFISGNIILILEQCSDLSEELKEQIQLCKSHLKSYQVNHLTYHWPLIYGKSKMPNSLIYKFLSYVHLSPDADCSVIQQLVMKNEKESKALLDELSHYRNDAENFVLPWIQDKLENSRGVFLTWFPEDFRCHPKKEESFDICVLANIVLFLSSIKQTEIKGYDETIKFIESSVNSDLFEANIYRFSEYYPNMFVALFLISRAIVWGKIDALSHLKGRILTILRALEIKSDMDYVCFKSVEKLWQESSEIDYIFKFDNSAFYFHAFTIGYHHLEFISRKRFIQMDFYSNALNLAMLRYVQN